MGGFGSGRTGGRPTTGQHFVRWAWKDCIGKGLNSLRPDQTVPDQVAGRGTSTWTSGWAKHEVDRAEYALHLRADGQHFIRFEHCAGSQDVRLAWLPRALGGGRWLMLCPYTGRRCWVLYKPVGHPSYGFGAPGVYRMHYTCQHESKADQATGQLLKIRKRLGDSSGDLSMETRWLPKPPRMHWRTFERLQARAARYEAIRDNELALALGRIMKRTGEDWRGAF